MKGDVRARVLMKLLDELPAGVSLTRCFDTPRDLADVLDDEEEGPEYLAWLRELDARLRPSQEQPDYDMANLPDPPPMPETACRGSWLVSFYDEFGENFDDTNVDLAEDPDIVRALLLAKNRLAAGRKIR